MTISLYSEYRLFQQLERYSTLYREPFDQVLLNRKFKTRAKHLQRLDDISVPESWRALQVRLSYTKRVVKIDSGSRLKTSFAEDAEHLIEQTLFGNKPSTLTPDEKEDLRKLSIHLITEPKFLQAFFKEFDPEDLDKNKRILLNLLKHSKASKSFPRIDSKIQELISVKAESKQLAELAPDEVIDLSLEDPCPLPVNDSQEPTIETLFNEVLGSISNGDTFRATHQLLSLKGLGTSEFDVECLSNALEHIRSDIQVPETGNEDTFIYKDGHPVKIINSDLWIIKVKDLHRFFRPADFPPEDFLIIDSKNPDIYIHLIQSIPEDISHLTFLALGGNVFTGEAEDIKIIAKNNEITLDNTKRPYRNKSSRTLLAARNNLNNKKYRKQINKCNLETQKQITILEEKAKAIVDLGPEETISHAKKILVRDFPEIIHLYQLYNKKTEQIENCLDFPETAFAIEIEKYSENVSVFQHKIEKPPMTTIQRDDLIKILNSEIPLNENDIHLLKLILIYNIYSTVEQFKYGLTFSNSYSAFENRNNQTINNEIKYREDKLKEIALSESANFTTFTDKRPVVFKLKRELPDSTDYPDLKINSNDGITISISPELADKALSKRFANRAFIEALDAAIDHSRRLLLSA